MDQRSVFAHLDDGCVLEARLAEPLFEAFAGGELLFFCEEERVMRTASFLVARSEEHAREVFFWDLEKLYVDELFGGALWEEGESEGEGFEPPKLSLPHDAITVRRVVRIEFSDQGTMQAA